MKSKTYLKYGTFLLLTLFVLSIISIYCETKTEKKAMETKRLYIYEKDVEKSVFEDRWSADLIDEKKFGTTGGFSLGVAEYSKKEFGKPQTHDDQEAVYILSGYGEYMLGDETFAISPGCAVYVPPHTKHAVRCTKDEPVKLIYTHAPVK